MIETAGYATAVYAADAALKAARVRLKGVERVIGVAGSLGVTVHLEGEVAAVEAAVAAGAAAGQTVGRVLASAVIARVHDEVGEKILPLFEPPGASGVRPTGEDTGRSGTEEEEKA
jgi:ethanolamine utilization protein EutM